MLPQAETVAGTAADTHRVADARPDSRACSADVADADSGDDAAARSASRSGFGSRATGAHLLCVAK
jgi:hypothetical protein